MKKFTPNIEEIDDNFPFVDFEQPNPKASKFKEESLKEEPEKFKPWRVFINHLDSYHGQKIVNVSVIILLKTIKKKNFLIFIKIFKNI